MPALVINNTVQLRLIWSLAGAPFAVNVFHGIKEIGFSTVSQDGTNQLAADLKTRFLASALKPQIHTSVALTQVGLRDLNGPNQPEFISAVTAAAGTATGDLLPLNVALCTTLRTAKAGASYRGRTYMTGYTEGNSTGGLPGQTIRDNTVAWVQDVKAAMDTAGLTMSVASRKLGISTEVTTILSRDQVWDTQRRRIIPGI